MSYEKKFGNAVKYLVIGLGIMTVATGVAIIYLSI
jgi:hypothetical protein